MKLSLTKVLTKNKKVGGAYNMTNYFLAYAGYSLNCYFSVLAFRMLIFGMKILYCVCYCSLLIGTTSA